VVVICDDSAHCLERRIDPDFEIVAICGADELNICVLNVAGVSRERQPDPENRDSDLGLPADRLTLNGILLCL
jgi:hypothetical protein